MQGRAVKDAKYEKPMSRSLAEASDGTISSSELSELLKGLGFEERIRGSHPVFRKQGVEEKINLRRESYLSEV